MMNLICVLCVLIALSVTAEVPCQIDDDHYIAGVVEFRPIVVGMSSADMLIEHLNAYLTIISSSKARCADILVFPEATLNSILQPTFVPSPSKLVAPCDVGTSTEIADFLVKLSCAARDVRKYLVINLTEQEKCPVSANDTRPCAANNLNVYNTNVVFDREGRVVSRYRKVHTYKEAKNTTLLPEYAIFETDFGVRFGHFICFDMNFYTPAVELVQRYGVRDIIFTSWFYSELPFLTAVQLQQAWAYGNNVNLLAAGASYPDTGTTGSGIYAGTAGQLKTLITDTTMGGQRKLLIARLPKHGSLQNVQVGSGDDNNTLINLPLMRDPQIESFTSLLLNWNATVGETLCHGDHCCRFEVALQSRSSMGFHYRIGVFNGERTYEEAELSNLKICALYACLNETVSSCGLLPSPSLSPSSSSLTARVTDFQMLRITGEFPKADQMLLMPNSVTSSLLPLKPTAFCWHVDNMNNVSSSSNNAIIQVQMELNVHVNLSDLLTFAIYGNYYDKSVAMPPLPTPTTTAQPPPTNDDDDTNGGNNSHTYFTFPIMAICFLLLSTSPTSML